MRSSSLIMRRPGFYICFQIIKEDTDELFRMETDSSFNGDDCYDNVANIDEKVGDVKTVVFGEQRKMIIVVDDDDNNDDD